MAAKKNSLTGAYESLPKLLKILIQIFLGAIVGGVYRIIRFVETGNVVTLVAGILCLFPPCDFIAWVVDLVTEITSDKISFFA